MPYTPSAIDVAAPLDAEKAKTAAAEFREIKRHIGKIPPTNISAAYLVIPADSGKQLRHPSADITARIWTMQAHATTPWQDGAAVTFVNRNGAGILTITPTDTMRLAGAGTVGNRTLAANGVATALFDITDSSWLISGTGLS